MEPRVETLERRSHQQCAVCHDALDLEPITCPLCDTALHGDCAEALGRCPTLGCPIELAPCRAEPSFADQMEARDGTLVRHWAAGGAALGLLAGVFVGNPVIGVMQGALLGPVVGLALRQLVLGTPPLGAELEERREL